MFPTDGQEGKRGPWFVGFLVCSFVDLLVSNFEDRIFPLLEIAGRPLYIYIYIFFLCIYFSACYILYIFVFLIYIYIYMVIPSSETLFLYFLAVFMMNYVYFDIAFWV